MGRLLGIDYGKVRIGIALSDPSQILATPICVLENGKTFTAQLRAKLSSYSPVEKIIIGLPLHLNGQDSAMCEEVRQFAKQLSEELNLPVEFWDERLTTAQIQKSFADLGMTRKEQAKAIDQAVASLILQSYIDTRVHARTSS